MTHEADLDGRCENCGMLIGFHGTHASKASEALVQKERDEYLKECALLKQRVSALESENLALKKQVSAQVISKIDQTQLASELERKAKKPRGSQ